MLICKASTLFLSRFTYCQACVLMLLSGLLIPAQAVETLKSDTLPQAQARLERLEQQVTSAQTATAQELKTLKKEVATVRATAQDCVEQAKPKIEKLDSELAILQPEKPTGTQAKTAEETLPVEQAQAPFSPAIARQLQDLQSRKDSLEGRMAICKLMLLR
ncbi:MAG: hypothetical protein WBN49_05195, partial [Arenicellales bacterium]